METPRVNLYHLSAYSINNSNRKLKSGVTLSLFQEAVEKADNYKNIIVTAHTGSGKTLAYLLRSQQYPLTVIIYPTNELIWDQAKAIEGILENEMNEGVAIAYERKREIIWWEKELNKRTTCVLYVINGESLSAIAESEGLTQGTLLLRDLEKARTFPSTNSRRLRVYILTNLSFLLLLHQYVYTKSQMINRILSMLGFGDKGALLIIDEFHNYFGPRLALLFYVLKTNKHLFTQRIFSSATPSKAIDTIAEDENNRWKQDSNICVIKAEKGTDRIVRHNTSLSIKPIPSGLLIHQPADIEAVTQDIMGLFIKNRSSEVSTKVLAIVNSVITCEQLFNKISARVDKNAVSRIHGLITKEVRRGAREAEIVIGTSAIEIGVNFDVASLVFEANDSSSFIQRLGRISRFRQGTAICYVPKMVFAEFGSRLTDSKIEYDDFIEISKMSMQANRIYEKFIKSDEGALLYSGVLYSTSKRARPDQRYPDQLILKAMRENPDYISADIAEKICKVVSDPKEWNIIRRLGKDRIAFGTSVSLPAYFGEFDAFDFVNLQDILRIEFEVLDKTHLPRTPPLAMKDINEFLYVKSIKEVPTRLYVHTNRPVGKLFVLTKDNFNLISDVNSHEGWLAEKLFGEVSYIGNSNLDWRLLSLRIKGDFNKSLYLGVDALVAHYLENNADLTIFD